jgi:hypothetical protein
MEMSEVQFNASIKVTELLMKTLENCAKDLASRCISEAALRHGFSAEEEIRVLGLENLSLIRKQMVRKLGGKKEKKEKVEKVEKKEKKSVFPMPFIAELVDITGCQGLAYNRGLFTQCSKKSMENGEFCKGCQAEADKNASGCPDCGTVSQRLSSGLYEFKDPKGRNPVSYLKVLEKLKLSKDNAEEEACKLNIEISGEHFVVLEKEKKSKGRPKKTGVVEADNVSDLFAKLSSEGEMSEEVSEGEEKPVKASKAKLSEEEKAAKKAQLEADRALKKAEREVKLAAEKAEKEAARKIEAEAKKAEREEKIAQEKAEREAKRAQEKAEREAKKAQEKLEKEAAKASKSKKSESIVAAPVVAAPVVAAPVVAAPTKSVGVKHCIIGGQRYLISGNNMVYDVNTKEAKGIYDPVAKQINDFPEDDDDEEEEEYDE